MCKECKWFQIIHVNLGCNFAAYKVVQNTMAGLFLQRTIALYSWNALQTVLVLCPRLSVLTQRKLDTIRKYEQGNAQHNLLKLQRQRLLPVLGSLSAAANLSASGSLASTRLAP